MDDASIRHLYLPSKVRILCVMLHCSALHKSGGATTEVFSAVEVGMSGEKGCAQIIWRFEIKCLGQVNDTQNLTFASRLPTNHISIKGICLCLK